MVATRFVDLSQRGVRLAYAMDGPEDAPVVVFAHGFAAFKEIWRYQVSVVASRFRVLCYDHRGHGESSDGAAECSIRDLSEDLLALLDALGVRRLRAVMGASMGALQAFEWAAAYPEMVERIVPVIGAAEVDAYTIGWLHLWGAPIRLDPRWNGGDYYGRDEPVDGLTLALKLVTLHARHWVWADRTYGRRWAKPDRDPGKAWEHQFAIEAGLESLAAARARVADANSFLYLVRANQLFVTGHRSTLEEGLKRVKAPVLLLPASSDLLLVPEHSRRVRALLAAQGTPVEYIEIEGDGGHLDGILAIAKVGDAIRRFLGR